MQDDTPRGASSPKTDKSSHQQHIVILFYAYTPNHEIQKNADIIVPQLLEYQRDICKSCNIQKGRILLASEGINGSVYGTRRDIQSYIQSMENFDLGNDIDLPDECVDLRRNGKIYGKIDWKKSEGIIDIEPFPDLKLSIVDELISTGGSVKVGDIEHFGGKHVSPEEFHKTLSEKGEKEVVLIDVRNNFEHAIGRFVTPDGTDAINPNTKTFQTFDSNFCVPRAEELKGKKILLYCTGGIRCEKASVMLRQKGVDDVSQLSGGIHRYLERYPENGFFKGKNFVFDRRVTHPVGTDRPMDVVGRCVSCSEPHDEIRGSRICTVCRDLVLVCPDCRVLLREFHCERHLDWKDCYHTFLEPFTIDQLERQVRNLDVLRNNESSKNVRRTLMKQIRKVDARIEGLRAHRLTVLDLRDAPRRCRSCFQDGKICDGMCWGFWKK